MSRKILITFIGLKDPYPEHDDIPGPILSLLSRQSFDEIFTLCSSSVFLERARDLEHEMQEEHIEGKVNIIDLALNDVISYEEIWQKLIHTLDSIEALMSSRHNTWHFLIDSGTPQMKACLFLAAKTGRYQTRILQGIPPYYAQGVYKVRDITDATPSIPVREYLRANLLHPETATHESTAHYVSENSPLPNLLKGLKGIIARSQGMKDALNRAQKASNYNEPVIIFGETGTGKTILARLIHETGSRRDAPFVELNCSAIPEGLAESTLFGHERGAYTGADRSKTGSLRTANKGTIFLDEIGDLPLVVQAKLLKAIEEKKFYPLGADKPVSVDVRIIAATNKNLKQKIAQGEFRRDLFERLNVISITIPPLRDRPEDMTALIEQTLLTWNEQYDEHKYLSQEAKQLLMQYSWPGNVRELINAVRSSAATAFQDEILPEHLPDDIRAASNQSAPHESEIPDLPENGLDLRARLLQIEWGYFSHALRKTNGNREAAARILGLTGHSFRKALRERFASFVQDEGWEEE